MSDGRSVNALFERSRISNAGILQRESRPSFRLLSATLNSRNECTLPRTFRLSSESRFLETLRVIRRVKELSPRGKEGRRLPCRSSVSKPPKILPSEFSMYTEGSGKKRSSRCSISLSAAMTLTKSTLSYQAPSVVS